MKKLKLKKKTVTVHMTEELADTLKHKAEILDISVAAYIKFVLYSVENHPVFGNAIIRKAEDQLIGKAV